MDIKIDLQLLDEQVHFLEIYASIITNEHKRELIDGVANLLSAISYAIEEDKEINFVRVN